MRVVLFRQREKRRQVRGGKKEDVLCGGGLLCGYRLGVISISNTHTQPCSDTLLPSSPPHRSSSPRYTSHGNKLVASFVLVFYFLYLNVTRRAMDVLNSNPVDPAASRRRRRRSDGRCPCRSDCRNRRARCCCWRRRSEAGQREGGTSRCRDRVVPPASRRSVALGGGA
jgi:hypothetical protein